MSVGGFFHRLEVLADAAERHLPALLRYDHSGDPASWLEHLIVCAFVADIGQLLSWLILHDARPGLRLFGGGAFVYYLVREIIQAIWHLGVDGIDEAIHIQRKGWFLLVGWGGDGVGDMLGPTAVLLAGWLS